MGTQVVIVVAVGVVKVAVVQYSVPTQASASPQPPAAARPPRAKGVERRKRPLEIYIVPNKFF